MPHISLLSYSCVKLLDKGLKPYKIQGIMDRQACAGLDEEGITAALRGRRLVTIRDVENVRKQWAAETRLDTNDVKAVEKLVAQHDEGPESAVLYHESDGDNFELALATPFQRRMLNAFGKELVFMDAVHGTNQYGYVTMALVVRDDYGNGVPVAFCVTTGEDSNRWARFLKAAFEVRRPVAAAADFEVFMC